MQILDYILKNNKTQKMTNKKEVILWVQECLSRQSERQGIGRLKFGFTTHIWTAIK